MRERVDERSVQEENIMHVNVPVETLVSAPMTMPPAYSHATMVVPVFGASCARLMLSMCAFAREISAEFCIEMLRIFPKDQTFGKKAEAAWRCEERHG